MTATRSNAPCCTGAPTGITINGFLLTAYFSFHFARFPEVSSYHIAPQPNQTKPAKSNQPNPEILSIRSVTFLTHVVYPRKCEHNRPILRINLQTTLTGIQP